MTQPASTRLVTEANLANPSSPAGAALSATFASFGTYTVDPHSYGAVGDSTTDDTAALQSAINAAGALAASAGIRVLVTLRQHKRYTASALTFPSYTGLTGGGELRQKAGATTHLLQLADTSSTSNVTIENISINGRATSQTVPLDAIHFDNSGATGSTPMVYHKVLNVHVNAVSGVGCYLGTFTRGCLVNGLTTYMCDQQGIVLGGADSRVANCDIGQSGTDGVYLSGTGYQVSNVKSWYSGRLDNLGAGFNIRGNNHTLSNCWSQDSMGNGFTAFWSGHTVTGLALSNCGSDRDNASLGGFAAFNLSNVQSALVTGQVTAVAGGRNGAPTNGVSLSGGSSGCEITLTVTGQTSQPVSGSAVSGNTVNLNGRRLKVTPVAYATTYTPNAWMVGETITMTLAGALTVNNPAVTPAGLEMLFIFTQDATGGRAVTWGSNFKIGSWTPDTTAGAVNSIRFRSDGTSWLQVGGQTGPVKAADVVGLGSAALQPASAFEPAGGGGGGVTTFRSTDQGYAAWSYDPATVSSQTAPGSGSILYVRVKALESRTLANLWAHVGTAGAGLTAAIMGVYDSTGNRLGITSDQSTAFQTAGSKACPLSAGVDVVAGNWYYIGILQVGTTPAALLRGYSGAPNPGNAGFTTGPYRFNAGATGQTVLPTSFTPSGLASSSVAWWLAAA